MIPKNGLGQSRSVIYVMKFNKCVFGLMTIVCYVSNSILSFYDYIISLKKKGGIPKKGKVVRERINYYKGGNSEKALKKFGSYYPS